MGDAADDVYESMTNHEARITALLDAGCKPCPDCHPAAAFNCKTCHNFGWLDKDGNPVES